ncbi:MAG: hypothetical protein A2W91_09065 [Bacteroidetes bacterium GWF2_38_335]|nr:MAG: hypothetical protein A2W91_09065 [Bacteroidetes bacterium GWF2_38_335]OFY80521.1 MAG: hypothetical protein A2281_08790 [Bacteroidetes bacterium RIFOXYA12_FULL_38_20]HBS85868.1 hypothetical protein [Bacteroidales bacterium]
MKYTATIVLCLACVFCSFSQPSGYIGKTRVASYRLSFLPTGYGLNHRISKLITFNSTHSLSFEKAIKNNLSLAVNLSAFSNKICTSHEPANIHVIANYDYATTIQPWGVFKYRGKMVGVELKSYVGGWIAPLGIYLGYGFSWNRISFKDVDKLEITDNYYSDGISYLQYDYEIVADPVSYLTGNIKMGKKSIISDKYTFDYGIEVNLVLNNQMKDYYYEKPGKVYFVYNETKERRITKLYNAFISFGYVF